MIIGLFKAYLICHFTFLLLGHFHSVDNLLENNGIVCGVSAWQEAALKRANEVAKNGSDSVN